MLSPHWLWLLQRADTPIQCMLVQALLDATQLASNLSNALAEVKAAVEVKDGNPACLDFPMGMLPLHHQPPPQVF